MQKSLVDVLSSEDIDKSTFLDINNRQGINVEL